MKLVKVINLLVDLRIHLCLLFNDSLFRDSILDLKIRILEVSKWFLVERRIIDCLFQFRICQRRLVSRTKLRRELNIYLSTNVIIQRRRRLNILLIINDIDFILRFQFVRLILCNFLRKLWRDHSMKKFRL